MEGFLALGFLIGLQHALEADHVAAVGAMVVDNRDGSSRGRRALTLRGAVWGLGHTITLFFVCGAVLVLGLNLSDQTAASMEFAVGVMLVVLGLDVIRRMRKSKVHFHVHSHDGKPHFHAHSHTGEQQAHDLSQHEHRHGARFPIRALFVGLIHGAAGSSALLGLAMATTRDPWTAVGYVLVFGFGSILGMAALTYIASWPLTGIARGTEMIHRFVSGAAAALAIGLGIFVMMDVYPTAFNV